MSADNYVEVDHDGDNFLVYHGSMSCVGDIYDDGTCYEPTLIKTVKTEEEVELVVNDIAIIEYGVDWTTAARAACGPSKFDKVVALSDKHTITLEELSNKLVNLANKLDEHMQERDAHNPGVMRSG